jgi:ESCRT-II complex subunit VPS22
MLGLGDWQYELGVQIVDVCVSTRARNGGMIEMSELVRMVGKLRGVSGEFITEEDVVRSIKTLEPLGAGYQVIDLGGRRMVRSVVKELDEDQAVILTLAQESGGRIVEEILIQTKGWTRDRATAALENMLLRDGLCWVDDQDEQWGRSYWVLSAMQWDI